MTRPATIAKAFGHQPTAPTWQVTSDPPVPVERFGKDHWSTFAYVEVRAVDHKGVLNHEHMRCDRDRHPLLFLAKKTTMTRMGMSGIDMHATKYPTRLKDGVEWDEHDDYDCLDDLVAAGLLEVTMPKVVDGSFVDVWGRPITDGGDLIDPGFVTGMVEQRALMPKAIWGLTEKGWAVATALREHKAAGGNWATFEVPAGLLDG